MNFCRFYNKAMNFFETISVKCGNGYIGSNIENNHYREEAYPRKNRKEINVFLGLFYILLALTFYILLALTCIFVVGLFGVPILIIEKIYTLTTSHCDLEEK